MQKIWRVAQAIGDIAFAYPYSLILLEIQVNRFLSELLLKSCCLLDLTYH
jgi:hypothetical protein